MNKQKSKYVEIPRATLNALKNFFVSENGVDDRAYSHKSNE